MRSVGIEIEFSAVHDRAALDSLCESHGWQVKTDSSVSGAGIEITSPPLRDYGSFAEVYNICSALQGIAAQDQTCGVHVHVDATGISPRQAARIALSWRESRVTEFLAPNRLENHFCKPVTDNEVICFLLDCGRDRYREVNFQSIKQHGTIEFRCFGNIFELGIVELFALFCLRFVEACLEPHAELSFRLGTKIVRLGTYSEMDTAAYVFDVRAMFFDLAPLHNRWTRTMVKCNRKRSHNT